MWNRFKYALNWLHFLIDFNINKFYIIGYFIVLHSLKCKVNVQYAFNWETA